MEHPMEPGRRLANAGPEGPRDPGGAVLTPAEFSSRFESASRTLWIIAAAVLGRRSDAEDVLQEAAMIGLRKVRDFDPSTSFSAWMGGIVRNVARNHARKRQRRHTTESDPQTIDASHTVAAPATQAPEFDRHGKFAVDQSAFDDRVLQALNTLDETARTCLLLRTLHEMPYREISLLMEIPEGTAMSHVHRARQALRGMLAPADEPKRRNS
jgi:RNA polymerase sigma-70 factor, ECF subfamily